MNLFIIITITIIILFLPLPLKIQIGYLNNNLVLKFYKFTIFSTKNGIENNLLNKLINKNRESKNIKEKGKKKSKKKISYISLYQNISTNKFKPNIKVKASITYGVEDAALCAFLYGLICNIPNFIYLFLNIVFKVKDLKFDINPKFNTTLLTFGITSIFYFNIANIIYMLFLLIKSKKFKEVDPNFGRNI